MDMLYTLTTTCYHNLLLVSMQATN